MKPNFIWEKKKSLDSDICNEVIQRFEDDNRKKAGSFNIGDVNPNIKDSTDLFITDLKDWNDIDEKFNESLQVGLSEYIDYLYKINPKLTPFVTRGVIDSGFQIQKTVANSVGYVWHDDDNIVQGIINQSPLRRLTFIWYLNDVSEGGETEFVTGEKITPEVGKLIFFPPLWTFLHRGIPPKSNTKYICTGWVCCKTRP
jgi:hypothetical protein